MFTDELGREADWGEGEAEGLGESCSCRDMVVD